jgi:hypothetical protein
MLPIEIMLTRSANNTHSIYGANNTTLHFSDENNTGLLSIGLRLERITPDAKVMLQVEKMLSKPFKTCYYRRIVDIPPLINNQSTAVHQISFTKSDNGRPKIFILYI